jgi:ABC-type branched-subunit amino acid transport system ATPase component
MEGRRVFDELTVENLVAGAHTRRHWQDAKKDMEWSSTTSPPQDRRHNISGYLSGGGSRCSRSAGR